MSYEPPGPIEIWEICAGNILKEDRCTAVAACLVMLGERAARELAAEEGVPFDECRDEIRRLTKLWDEHVDPHDTASMIPD